jgi:hypothetical protein
MILATNFLIFGGFWLLVPIIVLVILIVTMRGKADHSLSILSLISGILGLLPLPIVGSIAAIVSGNIALNQYKTSMEPTGSYVGMARAGVILGWIGLALWTVAVVGLVLFLVPVTTTITPAG